MKGASCVYQMFFVLLQHQIERERVREKKEES